MDGVPDSFQDSSLGGEEWLKSNGFELFQPRVNLDTKDSARDYIVKVLRERTGIRSEVDDRIIIGRIIYFLCSTRKLPYYKQIQHRDEAEDFIVIYSDFFMDSLVLIEEFDDRPIGEQLHLTYWAHVEEMNESGNVLVSSKTVGNKVYKHQVNNDLVLNRFCKSRESFVYINIYTIKQFFLNLLEQEH